jgi:hypothetical protein
MFNKMIFTCREKNFNPVIYINDVLINFLMMNCNYLFHNLHYIKLK